MDPSTPLRMTKTKDAGTEFGMIKNRKKFAKAVFAALRLAQ